ncbi:MAG: acetylornithine transaminase [Nitrospinaceae bacterium]
MKRNEDIVVLSEAHLLGNYRRVPLALVRGKGLNVWDKSGRRYLDFIAGIAVASLGHCPPTVVQAVQRQAARLLHVSNLVHIEPQTLLARELTDLCFADKAFFCNSGTEANEAALKLARKYFSDRGRPECFEIVTIDGSFHGRTLGSLSATGQAKMQAGFGPLVPGFKHVPFDDLPAMERAIQDKTCAVLIEPILGETGVILPSRGYLKGLRRLCNKKKVLLILDEIQTGMGRTGTLFAHEGENIRPDIMTLAKGLGGGVPIGVLLTTDRLARSLGPGTHGTTFGGNPLACAAARAVLKKIARPSFLARVREMGDYFMNQLQTLAARQDSIKNIRGRGLMIGVDLTAPSAQVAGECLQRGVLVNSIAPHTLRLVPPLVVSKREINTFMRVLAQSLEACGSGPPK